jgi:hypothetical protein
LACTFSAASRKKRGGNSGKKRGGTFSAASRKKRGGGSGEKRGGGSGS